MSIRTGSRPARGRCFSKSGLRPSLRDAPTGRFPRRAFLCTISRVRQGPLFLDKRSLAPVDYIHIPNLPRCDGAIYVVGDSMYPLLKSGDIVLYKQIGDVNDIFWGDMYLLSIDIDGEEYVTVKYIQKSEKPGCVKLVSQNPHHADKDIEIGRIRALAFVKASIRMNSIR